MTSWREEKLGNIWELAQNKSHSILSLLSFSIGLNLATGTHGKFEVNGRAPDASPVGLIRPNILEKHPDEDLVYP